MGVYGGNIGPRRPSQSGETCGNCDGAFVMSPGIYEKDGQRMIKWVCGQCKREEYWPAPYNMQSGGKVQKVDDFME